MFKTIAVGVDTEVNELRPKFNWPILFSNIRNDDRKLILGVVVFGSAAVALANMVPKEDGPLNMVVSYMVLANLFLATCTIFGYMLVNRQFR